MRCRYCQRADDLITEGYVDEDGFASDDPIDLCHGCVEHAMDRHRARQEWNAYHDEPCPEIELPQPAPARK